MFRRAQDRIRTYFYKTRDELVKSGKVPPSQVQNLFSQLQEMLKSVKFFGCYFDRTFPPSDGPQKSLCNTKGTIMCQGRWDKKDCLYPSGHEINPYKSREDRIVFQTWNLDHTIERSRSVIPAIKEALAEGAEDENKNGKCKLDIDVKAIFRDLFTLSNLKMVHIVCHDKGSHFSMSAGPYLL